jgi:hypothetical protein
MGQRWQPGDERGAMCQGPAVDWASVPRSWQRSSAAWCQFGGYCHDTVGDTLSNFHREQRHHGISKLWLQELLLCAKRSTRLRLALVLSVTKSMMYLRVPRGLKRTWSGCRDTHSNFHRERRHGRILKLFSGMVCNNLVQTWMRSFAMHQATYSMTGGGCCDVPWGCLGTSR